LGHWESDIALQRVERRLAVEREEEERDIYRKK
jgi:hypothetical protein